MTISGIIRNGPCFLLVAAAILIPGCSHRIATLPEQEIRLTDEPGAGNQITPSTGLTQSAQSPMELSSSANAPCIRTEIGPAFNSSRVLRVQRSNDRSSTMDSDIAPATKESFTEETFDPVNAQGDWTVPFLFGVPVVFGFLGIGLFSSRAMRISAWSAHHPLKSKSILAILQTGAMGASYSIGNYLMDCHVNIEDIYASAGLSAFVGSALLYPGRSSSPAGMKWNYINRKFYDVLIFSSGLTMMTYAGNHQLSFFRESPAPYYASVESSYDQERVWPPIEKQEDPPKKNGKIALTILASIVFTAFALVVAALSCVLMCEGQGALAALLLLGGETGLTLAYISILKSIGKHYKVKRRKEK